MSGEGKLDSKYDNRSKGQIPKRRAGEERGRGTSSERGGKARVLTRASVFFVQGDALCMSSIDVSALHRRWPVPEGTARSQCARIRGKDGTHQELDEPDLALLHARLRSARRHRDHELERDKAVVVCPDRLRAGGAKTGLGSTFFEENKRGGQRRTVFMDTLRACRVRRMCEYLYL